MSGCWSLSELNIFSKVFCQAHLHRPKHTHTHETTITSRKSSRSHLRFSETQPIQRTMPYAYAISNIFAYIFFSFVYSHLFYTIYANKELQRRINNMEGESHHQNQMAYVGCFTCIGALHRGTGDNIISYRMVDEMRCLPVWAWINQHSQNCSPDVMASTVVISHATQIINSFQFGVWLHHHHHQHTHRQRYVAVGDWIGNQ